MTTESARLFWNKIDKTNPGSCWLWTGSKRTNGYGNCTIKDISLNKYRYANAQRVAYYLTHGEFNTLLDVCHTCDVRLCCNPGHLFLGTRSENLKDAQNKLRLTQVFPKGEKHKSAKLTETQVLEIRDLILTGKAVMDIALEFKVAACTISQIKHRRKWRHI